MSQTPNTKHQTPNTKQRIEYLDALRGLTMLLVVLGHVSFYNLGVEGGGEESIHAYLRQIRLPLFFFVSGFLLYKKDFVWNLSNTINFLKKKFIVQILSPFLFLSCYIICKELPYIESITHSGKVGYWFTFALFNYFVLYIALRKIFDAIKIKESKALIAILFIGVTLYYLPTIDILTYIHVPQKILNLSSIGYILYFFFFVFGIHIRRNFNIFEKIINGSSLLAIVVIIFFALHIFVDTNGTDIIAKFLNKSKNITLGICGIIIVFSLFKKQEQFFASNNYIANTFKYIGKRTLDIYLLHYFFLTPNLSKIFPFFAEHNLPIIEFTVSLIMGIIIIGACLIISSILRLNNTMAHYLFGAKKKK